MEPQPHPNSHLGSQILLLINTLPEIPKVKKYKVKLGPQLTKFMRYKQQGITEEEPQPDEDNYISEDSDMEVDNNIRKNKVEIQQTGIKLTFDREVLDILAERVNIKNMEVEIK